MNRLRDHVRCVTITHPLCEIREYRELSAFFRFLGIFVCEIIEGKESGDPTDYTISLNKDNIRSGVKLFKETVQGMSEVLSQSTITLFADIGKIFADRNLMRGSYAIAYFADSGKSYIYEKMYKAYDGFRDALKDLEELEERKKEERVLKKTILLEDDPAWKYLLLAKSNCKRRMNELYTIIWNAIKKGKLGENETDRGMLKSRLWKKTLYSFDCIDEDIKRVLETEPDFYGAYMIRGFSAELDKEHRFWSVEDLLNVIKCIGDCSYGSYILYRIGRYCETIRGNLDEKWEYYRRACEADPRNYRALYKMAVYRQNSGCKEEAEDIWKRIIEILEEKRNLPVLQPVECAYLYKAFSNLGRLYIRKGNIRKGIKYLVKAIDVYENISNEIEPDAFYPWMFGRDKVKIEKIKKTGEKKTEIVPEWKIYKTAAKEKLNISSVYEYICEAAEKAGMTDIYEEYYKKLLAVQASNRRGEG